MPRRGKQRRKRNMRHQKIVEAPTPDPNHHIDFGLFLGPISPRLTRLRPIKARKLRKRLKQKGRKWRT